MRLVLLVIGSMLCLSLQAQELPLSTQQQLENLGNEDLEDDALLQQLDFYRQHPLNLNTAMAEDLQALRLLTDLQITNLLRYRSLFGKFIDLYELQAVPGFDLLTIRKIRPYIIISSATTIKEDLLTRLKGGDQYAMLRYSRVLERQKGYDTSLTTHYLGDPNRLLLRYRYQYKNLLYYGLVADKDAGEQFLAGPQKAGFDFYSVHFFARNLGKLKALAIGDYVVNLGQGLTQWQSLGFGKSAEPINIKRQSAVLLPYRSSGEAYFSRGVAATVGGQHWEGTGFVSYKKFSGNLEEDSTNHFTSLQTSGYHRTRNEITDRNKLSDLSFGGNLTYKANTWKVSLNGITHRFSLPMEKRDEPYNRFAFSGQQAVNASIDYSYTYKNAHFFGELAVDRRLQRAVIQGAMLSLDKRVDLSLLYRNLPKDYQNLFGNAFTENSLPINERGIYVGLSIKPVNGWQISAYADYYHFGFLKYRVSAPTKGWDYLAQVSFLPNKETEVYLRYRNENKPINEPMTFPLAYPVSKAKQNLRLHFGTKLNTLITLKGRTEMVWFDKNGADRQEGFLSYMEIAYQSPKRIKGNVRLQYFETGGYDSRIYAYESDVLYSFSIPAFYDKGFRYYLNASFTLSRKATFWLRFAQTVFANREFVGTGLDEIAGNQRSEIKLQLKYIL